MSIPGFNADASAYAIAEYHGGEAKYSLVEQKIYLASYIEQTCFNVCYDNCNRTCFGMVGPARSACLRDCKKVEQDCRAACTKPGTPPSSGGGSAGGLPIYGNYCGPGHGDRNYQTLPVDAVDAVCMAHDRCYDTRGYFNCACDRALITSMPAAIASTPSPAGKVAGTAAAIWFSGAPCNCGGWPGFGGVGLC